ncbi:hypothetical protein ABT294_50070 [Nonomuraea sp. NPDC000554]|uniref:hypothetical protein n=1 Tax=Nonomuraea sp. NPDC000554 TaxID=3154259 RepID=UPI00332A19AD
MGSLFAGSVLAMAGQYLSDKRTARREQNNRREEFRRIAFEHERPALLELQEIIAEFSQLLFKERARRTKEGEHAFFDHAFAELSGFIQRSPDQFHDLRRAVEENAKNTEESAKRAVALLKGVTPDTDQRELRRQLSEVSEQLRDGNSRSEAFADQTKKVAEAMKTITSNMNEMTRRFDAGISIAKAFIEFTPKARLRIYRSGSNAVVNTGNDYITAVANWLTNLGSAGEETLWENTRNAESDFYRAVANVLHSGPYYVPDNTKES